MTFQEQIKFIWFKVNNEVYKYDIDYIEIKECVDKRFPTIDYELEITDLHKKTSDYKTMKELALVIPVRTAQYVREKFDCEDFSRVADGAYAQWYPQLATGRVFVDIKGGGKHALNFCITKTDSGKTSFNYIEPQTGKMFFTNNYRPYLIVI